MSTDSKLKQTIWKLVLLTAAGSLIYGLPYFRSYYYDAYLDVYNLSNTQMGMFGSMFGIFGAISYLFGGVLADIISPRKLLSVSMVLSGLAGLLHLLNPSYGMLLVIYMVWGFTSLFAFWPALLKALRGLASEHEQSKAYGFMEGGRGVVNAIHLAITLAIFNYFSKAASNLAGLNGVIIFYSAIVILLGIFIFILMKEEKMERSGEKFNFGQVLTVLKMPAVWILSLILCCTYTMNIAFYYFTPYATSAFGVTATGAAMVTMLAQYIRPFASAGGGIIGDKLGRGSTMVVGFGLSAVIYFGMYFNYGLVFSMMDEGGIPTNVAGTAIGVVCTLGYLPEVFCPIIAGRFLDTYPETGYQYFFICVGAMLVLGIFALGLWKRHLKKMETQKVV